MAFRHLDLNLLRVFNQVMLERSLTRAAAKLAMTQPAVSNAIQRLRDTLDDELVVRSGYGVQPTARAKALWPTVQDALARLEAAVMPTDFDPRSDASTFQLAMADATATVLMPALVRLIEAEAPQMTLRILPLTTRDPRTMLESSELDLAIGYFPVAMAAIRLHAMQDDLPDTFHVEPLYSGPYICAMRKDHPLAAYPTLGLDEYCAAHHLLVSYSGRPFGFVDRVLGEMGRSRRIVLTVNQFFTAGQVVAHSDLLTVLPEHFLAATGYRDRLAVRPIPFEIEDAQVDALWHRNDHLRPAHRWLREAVRRAAAHGFREQVLA